MAAREGEKERDGGSERWRSAAAKRRRGYGLLSLSLSSAIDEFRTGGGCECALVDGPTRNRRPGLVA